MKIAIIGTGNVGGALATKWAVKGHEIILGVRDTRQFKGRSLLKNPNTRVEKIQTACHLANTILIAIPPQFVEPIIESLGKEKLTGKTVIDATNAFRTRPDNYPTVYHAFRDLTEAEVVKCFNSTGYENMLDPEYGELILDMFMAGSSNLAKADAKILALDAGFENCYDFGGEDRVGLLEKFALSWINLAIFQGLGRDMGIKVLFRNQ